MPRRNIVNLEECKHGGPDYAELERLKIAPDAVIDFSVSSSPNGIPPGIRPLVKSTSLSRYPDSQSTNLRRAIARKEGLLGLETIAETESDVFARKSLQLLVDGNDSDVIKRVLQVEINSKQQYDHHAATIVESMGRYSIFAGILAAIIGLMPVTHENLPTEALRAAVEAALIALVYGICFAQFVFVPCARKLNYVVAAQAQIQTMLLEGVLSIAEGENPRNIESKLQGFIP
ncbi:MotA/TolQ/ExbB proton channel family protein [Kaarinaea lacus]